MAFIATSAAVVMAAALIFDHRGSLNAGDWLGFGGSVLGGVLTFIGAVMAWKAMREASDRDDARDRRREAEARELAVAGLKELFDWHAGTSSSLLSMGKIGEPTEENEFQRFETAFFAFSFERKIKYFDQIEPAMSLRDRAQFADIHECVRWIIEFEKSATAVFNDDKRNTNDIDILRTISEALVYLFVVAQRRAKKFDERITNIIDEKLINDREIIMRGSFYMQIIHDRAAELRSI